MADPRPRIPFNRPGLAGREFEYMSDAIRGLHVSGNGPYTRRCQTFLEQQFGVARALLTSSCTDALEMAALLLDIGPGDEVVVPAFTFVSSVNAFVLRGAKPVFVDVRPDTLNLDHDLLGTAIGERCKAVVPVHYAGVACDMDAIGRAAAARGAAVVEDNAHGIYGTYHGRPLGTLGALATLSFHETKNFICGEGGALLVNRPELVDRAEILLEKGTDRRRFFRGLVDKYTWVDVGSSFLPSDMLAAFLFAQLEAHDAIQARRRAIWNAYHAGLASWARASNVRLPTVPAGCEQAYHMFWMVLPSQEARARLISALAERGIQAVFHYVSLNTTPMGRRLGGRPGDCPVAEAAADRLLRLPFFSGITDAEIASVVEAVCEFRP